MNGTLSDHLMSVALVGCKNRFPAIILVKTFKFVDVNLTVVMKWRGVDVFPGCAMLLRVSTSKLNNLLAHTFFGIQVQPQMCKYQLSQS